MSKWTFEMQSDITNVDGWTTSSKRFDNLMDAANAATDWLLICAGNDIIMSVRVKEVKEQSHD